MKIVCIDNFDRDYIDDELVCENINSFHGEHIVNFLNSKFAGEDSPYWYRLVNDDYKLHKFEP